ncbi:unnamed protein product [Citrullus colocynthis]|uniref:Uncharacterized protein n=1 Tax=Citrullus colocynthis TaxID=252529 RepID=A0ABP0YAE7_9ROSI
MVLYPFLLATWREYLFISLNFGLREPLSFHITLENSKEKSVFEWTSSVLGSIESKFSSPESYVFTAQNPNQVRPNNYELKHLIIYSVPNRGHNRALSAILPLCFLLFQLLH